MFSLWSLHVLTSYVLRPVGAFIIRKSNKPNYYALTVKKVLLLLPYWGYTAYCVHRLMEAYGMDSFSWRMTCIGWEVLEWYVFCSFMDWLDILHRAGGTIWWFSYCSLRMPRKQGKNFSLVCLKAWAFVKLLRHYVKNSDCLLILFSHIPHKYVQLSVASILWL